MKLEHSLTPSIKINSKQIKDLNVRTETLRLLEENIGRTLFDITAAIFLDLSPRVMEIKIKVYKWDLAFAQLRKLKQGEKDSPQNGRK